MICVKEWKRKTLHTFKFWHVTHMRTTEQTKVYCTGLSRLFCIGNSLCSLERDLLYIVEFLFVIPDNIIILYQISLLQDNLVLKWQCIVYRRVKIKENIPLSLWRDSVCTLIGMLYKCIWGGYSNGQIRARRT